MTDSLVELKEKHASADQASENPSLRILVVCGGFQVFGKERVVLELLRGLRDRGYELFCLTNAWSDGNFIRHLEDLRIPYMATHLGWVYLKKPKWTLHTLLHFPYALLQCIRAYRSFRPDVVIHDSYRTITQLGWMKRRRNVFMVQDYCTAWNQRQLLRAQDRRVAAYVPCSKDVAHNLVNIGLNAAKIHVVDNPVTFGDAEMAPSSTRARHTRIGIVGQIIERKGHHILIEAIGRIKQQWPQTELCLKVFGDGPADYRSRLEALAERLGVSSVIEWCGYKNNRAEIYGEIDFNVVPCVNPEPFGLVVVEPAVFMKPVIASALGGISGIVHDGVTGLLTPPGVPNALADRILQFIRDPSLVSRMGEAAHNDYKARFNSEVFIDRYEAIVQSVNRHAVQFRGYESIAV